MEATTAVSRWLATALAGLLALLLAACQPAPPAPSGADGTADGTADGAEDGVGTGGARGTSPGRCTGVGPARVQGSPPSPDLPLRDYPTASAVCEAWWIPAMAGTFVPQGLEVDGDLAYVSGYRVAALGRRACQVVVLDLDTGRQVAFVRRFEAPIYGADPTYCRHGGGNELTDEGLWIAGGQVLWLLDPARVRDGRPPVLRAWRLEDGLMGSTLAIHDGALVIGTYRAGGRGRWFGYDLDEVLARGVSALGLDATTGGQVTPGRRGRVATRLQGLSLTPRGRWEVGSRISCGLLHPPGPAGPVDFVPGAEDLEVVGPDVWTVSEASAAPYAHLGDDARVPGLLRLDRRALLAGTATCDLG
ncbi:hypothetical protein [Nocardioides solisilvae]|uniref:hypothetical protein n=1 Tax=Nocardioides solisilvae TaxID=1542435 RepID=UPI000D74C527|nr:hypothetical protein [Nocardioides solisilvae]